MKIEKILITPEMAKKYLDKNENNRPVKKSRVAQYAKDIRNDKWIEDTGETIKIDKVGKVLDGQHRLMAVIAAEKPAYFHVCNDLDANIFNVIDTGIKRTGADVLSISGIKNSTIMSSIINRFIYIKTGSIRDSKKGTNSATTNHDVLTMYNTMPKVWDGIAENTIRWYRQFNHLLSYAQIGGWYATFFNIDQDAAFSFFDQLCTGDGITNPTINVLRNALTKDKLSQNKMQEAKKSIFILKTWNCFRKGTTLQFLKYDATAEEKTVAI